MEPFYISAHFYYYDVANVPIRFTSINLCSVILCLKSGVYQSTLYKDLGKNNLDATDHTIPVLLVNWLDLSIHHLVVNKFLPNYVDNCLQTYMGEDGEESCVLDSSDETTSGTGSNSA